MSNRERRKGAGGEREVVAIFEQYFPDSGIERAKLGRQAGLDLVRVPDTVVSVKRQEVLRLPAWVREAETAGDGIGLRALVAYRTSAGGPMPRWRGDMQLEELARLIAAAHVLPDVLEAFLRCARYQRYGVTNPEELPFVLAARRVL